MRVALMIGSPPKKLGTLEQWILGVCAEAVRRGHTVDMFTLTPVHPEVQREADRLSVGVIALEPLLEGPVAASRRLAGYDLLYVNLFLPRSKAALICYAAWPAKVVFVDRCSGSGMAVAPLRKQLSRALDQVTFSRVDAVVGVSRYVCRRDAERFGLHPLRTRVIYNGVDISRFSTEKTPSPNGAPRLLCVAQQIPEKGIDVLLRAMTLTRARDCTLRVAGYGRMEEPYRALAHELGLDGRVEFLGMRHDVHLLLRDTDVAVHPAVWEEAFGLTVAEGMASGCAVIATRSGGIPEIIDDGVDGLLVPKGDAALLASAIDMVAFNPELRARLGAEGRRKVERSFTLTRCIREHVDCMEDVVVDRSSAPVRRHPAPESAAPPSFHASTGPRVTPAGSPAESSGPPTNPS